MNLIDVSKAFQTDEQCLEYIEKMRWPNGVRCVTCGNDKLSVIERQSESKNKRGIIGNYHRVSIKHLQKYLNEFEFRFNRREAKDVFEQTISRLAGNGKLTYRELVGV